MVTLRLCLGAGRVLTQTKLFMVKSCIDGYSIKNNRNNCWQNKFCIHDIHEKATLPKKYTKEIIRFVLLKIFRDNASFSTVSSLPCSNQHFNTKKMHSNTLLSLPHQLN